MLRGEECQLQTGHNDFEHGKAGEGGRFMEVVWEQGTNIFIYLGFHLIVNYKNKNKLTLTKTIGKDSFVMDKRSVILYMGTYRILEQHGKQVMHFCVTCT